jgi:hypothetical protein
VLGAPQSGQGGGQFPSVGGYHGVAVREPLVNREALPVSGNRHVEVTRLRVDVAEAGQAHADCIPPRRISRLGLGQLPPDRQGLLVLGLRRRRLARLRQNAAEIAMAVGQGVAEFRDRGVVVGQLLPDRQGLTVLGLRLRCLARP